MELQGHQPMIDKVVATGTALQRANHFASKPIEKKSKELKESWDGLLECSKDRKKKLDLALQTQKVNRLKTWFITVFYDTTFYSSLWAFEHIWPIYVAGFGDGCSVKFYLMLSLSQILSFSDSVLSLSVVIG